MLGCHSIPADHDCITDRQPDRNSRPSIYRRSDFRLRQGRFESFVSFPVIGHRVIGEEQELEVVFQDVGLLLDGDRLLDDLARMEDPVVHDQNLGLR